VACRFDTYFTPFTMLNNQFFNKTLLVLTLLVAGALRTSAQTKTIDCCVSQYAGAELDTLALNNLGKEFLRLKKLQKNCKTCGNWRSDYMAVMEALSRRTIGLDSASFIKLMGPPDEVEKGKLYYYFRQRNDFYIYSFGKGKVAGSFMWRAGE